MAYKLGLDCTLTVDSVEIENAKDVTLNIEAGDADVTTRNSNGWRAHLGTLKDASIEFNILTGGDSFSGLLSMFTGRTAASVAVSGGNLSFSASMVVTNFAVSQPLEDGEGVAVTLRPSLGSTPSFSCATASNS